MKLNTTYPLKQLIEAVYNASENTYTVLESMKRENITSCAFISFSTEGMLSSSPYARVTLTHQTSPDRWEGYMETTANIDGPRTPCAVVRNHNMLVANQDYTQVTICENFNNPNQKPLI